jgi:hypothetical protein
MCTPRLSKPATFRLCRDLAAMDRRSEGESSEHQLFAFLTTESNEIVHPIHSKAMPALLTTADEWDTWLDGPVEQAIALQRPLANDLLCIVATGEKSDPGRLTNRTGVGFIAFVRFRIEGGLYCRQAPFPRSAIKRPS